MKRLIETFGAEALLQLGAFVIIVGGTIVVAMCDEPAPRVLFMAPEAR